MKDITYMSEQDKEYSESLAKIKTLEELLLLLKDFECVAWDALEIAQKFDEKRFEAFIEDTEKERRGVFSENEDAMIIMMPAIMLKVSMIANKFMVPWGCAFLRLVESEKIKHQGNRYYFIES